MKCVFQRLGLVAVLCTSPVFAQTQTDAPAAFPIPSRLVDPDWVGHGVQRTMTLLDTSSENKRNTVRILL